MTYITHGDSHSRLYSIWKNMKARCYSQNWKPYRWYGARGIAVCDEWRESFSSFREWALENGYSDNTEIDRIDVDGDYEPLNCRWTTHHEQTLNRRDTLYCIVGETKMTLHDYCIDRGLSRNTANAWRYLGILEEKLSEIEGRKVVVIGGRKTN